LARRGGLLLAVLFAGPACAQVSGSAAWLSNDRYRGASLSDDAPTAQLTLAWDGVDGWYAGAQFTRVRFDYPGAGAELEAAPYLGYVRALGPRTQVEAGAQYTWFSRSQRYAYPELYAGISGERLHARLAWIHGYFGLPADAWYGELNGDRPLHGPWRLLGHVGVMRQQAMDTYAGAEPSRWRYDIAAGAGVAWSGFDLQATWTTTSATPYATCAPWQCGARNAWVLRMSRSW
jgi:uncharacterized protein (TIGR02001 family)